MKIRREIMDFAERLENYLRFEKIMPGEGSIGIWQTDAVIEKMFQNILIGASSNFDNTKMRDLITLAEAIMFHYKKEKDEDIFQPRYYYTLNVTNDKNPNEGREEIQGFTSSDEAAMKAYEMAKPRERLEWDYIPLGEDVMPVLVSTYNDKSYKISAHLYQRYEIDREDSDY